MEQRLPLADARRDGGGVFERDLDAWLGGEDDRPDCQEEWRSQSRIASRLLDFRDGLCVVRMAAVAVTRHSGIPANAVPENEG